MLFLIELIGVRQKECPQGLLVMLEKTARVAMVAKFGAILLIEVDFNYHNQLIFGK